MREKVANKVLFDQETYDSRLLTEIPKVRACGPHEGSVRRSELAAAALCDIRNLP